MIDRAQQASQELYETVATIDPMALLPVMRPLAHDFIHTIAPGLAPLAQGRALDVGTGLGLAAYKLAEQNLSVIGLDLSAAMLRVAARLNDPIRHIDFVCADIMQPPFAAAAFDLIVASFSLNLTSPRQSLLLMSRLLKTGGSLFVQEWAAEDRLSIAFDATFAAHCSVDPAVEQLVADLPNAWSAQMQDTGDYREQLESAGFRVTMTSENAPVAIPLESAEVFIAYKLAWPTYRRPWEALNVAAQSALHRALMSVFAPYMTPNGGLIWQPNVFRAAGLLHSRR